MITSLNEMEKTICKDLTNGICLAGSNHFSMENLLSKKYISKTEFRRLLAKNREYLQSIERAKNALLTQLYL
jgi:hypothetical protein